MGHPRPDPARSSWRKRSSSWLSRAAPSTASRCLDGCEIFRPAVDRYVASLGGTLPYTLRLREVELKSEAHERRVDVAWHELADERAGAAEFERLWWAAAAR